ncbi:tetratricopeptide repeat protein [Alcanivorax sp. S6407]|uniref:tetratricopeptide repeat protein n=1 Tax=Alcanivorax sp. S6407 TaxID=2926424 RepID=UPI001FF57A6C|nr:tetratricopeptide repeat protein [Alcanivorax sp. S6407]MCK0154174.1 tetratricopeptide repeat protein [Alcanivorax sp. S6407]
MMPFRFVGLLAASVMLASCASVSEKGTIAELRNVKLDLSDEVIEGGIEKAMQSYQNFLEETPESAMTPEAIRRLADLKIEREYGTFESPGVGVTAPVTGSAAATPMDAPESSAIQAPTTATSSGMALTGDQESESDFESRATQTDLPAAVGAVPEDQVANGLENQSAEEAIGLYKQLLEKYPMYERNDQVLYQMTRAYEELGRVDEAVEVMNRIAADYPNSDYIDEIQFRRGEYYFTRKKYLDAENAYLPIVNMGPSSFYYELSLYKLGWTFYKQDMLEEGMNQFVALLDHKINIGYDFENPDDDIEQKRIDDTFRVISLSFSAMGGPDAVVDYFNKHGSRSYEVDIYRNLGEHYLEKRRYADAASSYKTFVELNPYHKVAPHFDMRVIEIYKKGGFPKLVIEANKEFATSYGLKSKYWQHFEVDSYPDVLALLKSTLTELANYYHAMYQNKDFVKQRADNFVEAQHWYHEFLDSFPKDEQAPVMNYQLADLLLENKSYHEAALEYERTAYDYPAHEKASAAGYAAVYTHRKNLEVTEEEQKDPVKRDVIRSSLRFSEAFPEHEKASLVMNAALEDIFAMKDYAFAVTTGRKMLEMFPQAPQEERRSGWLIVAHSSFELEQFADAEAAYQNVLNLTAPEDPTRKELVENLAASIYKQGEQANERGEFLVAAEHFLRVGQAAPQSKLRPSADYDAATALIKLENWGRSATVLTAFRNNYPGHELQADVTKKLAQVYSEDGKLALAAAEYERIESESDDEAIRREALKVAADLYMEVDNTDKAIEVRRRFIQYFPEPREPVMEMHNAIAGILETRGDTDSYRNELNAMVYVYSQTAAEARSDRMRYLAGTSHLKLTEPMYDEFAELKLTQPFQASLKRKRDSMKAANAAFGQLVDYEIGEVTAAATYYIAEIYYNFSRSLLNSERPSGLSELEMQQYEFLLDEQSYPFEEKSIDIHEKNVGLIDVGVYNDWVDRSIVKLSKLMPGRYAKFEESSGFIAMVNNVSYQSLVSPQLPVAAVAPAAEGMAAPAAPAPAVDGIQAVPMDEAADSSADVENVESVEGVESADGMENVAGEENGETVMETDGADVPVFAEAGETAVAESAEESAPAAVETEAAAEQVVEEVAEVEEAESAEPLVQEEAEAAVVEDEMIAEEVPVSEPEPQPADADASLAEPAASAPEAEAVEAPADGAAEQTPVSEAAEESMNESEAPAEPEEVVTEVAPESARDVAQEEGL